MTYTVSPLRPSIAAIAAALALSTTPAFAQTDLAATPAPAPVTIAPAAPVVAPAETASPAPAADQTSNMSSPIDDTPTTPMATRSPVVVHTAPASTAAEPANAAPVAVAKTRPAAVTAASVATPKTEAPAAAAPVPAPVLRNTPPAQTSQTQTKVSTSTQTDETALYAGLGGAAVLLLGGGAFALSRRKRRDDIVDETPVYEETYVAAAPIVTEPRYDTAPVVPVVRESEETELANGFDLSRFGPHTRAAYRGPTEDNPSLSLRKRLKVASFMDGRLRQADASDDRIEEGYVEPGTIREVRKPVVAKMSNRFGFTAGPRASFRPATA